MPIVLCNSLLVEMHREILLDPSFMIIMAKYILLITAAVSTFILLNNCEDKNDSSTRRLLPALALGYPYLAAP